MLSLLLQQQPPRRRGSVLLLRGASSPSSDGRGQNRPPPPPPPPPAPTTCCMTGCANCVWIDHAEELVRYYAGRGDELDVDALMEEVDRGLEDEMVKAFVKTEIRLLAAAAEAEMKKKREEDKSDKTS